MSSKCNACDVKSVTGTSIQSLMNQKNDDKQDTKIQLLYKIIGKYFSNMKMFKLNDIFETQLSIYKANIQCSLCSEYRYCIAICPIDYNQIGEMVLLSDLKWKSFQTRSSTTDQSGNFSDYTTIIDPLLDSKIELIKVENDKSIYRCLYFPITIELLHKKKHISAYEQTINQYPESEYSKTGTIKTAISTYKCVIIIN